MDARMLLAHVLGINPIDLLIDLIKHEEPLLSVTQIKDFKKLIGKRQTGIPIAYLIGNCEFWSLSIEVNKQVLIPRGDTETLVVGVLGILNLDEYVGDANTSVLELGTGSGAVALALASELPEITITATDNSLSALAVAQHNQATLNGLVRESGIVNMSNIQFLHSDWFENISTEKYHLICSNPPYLAANDIHLQCGDLRFEPRKALVADEYDMDGYGAITHIIRHAKSYIHQSGWLALEHGSDQRQGVQALLADYGYTHIVTEQDVAGCDRVTVAQVG